MSVTFRDLAADIVSALTTQTVGGVVLTSGTNLFSTTTAYPTPSMSVMILNTGGPAPEPYINPTAGAVTHPTAQVLIHCQPGKPGYAAGLALMLAVMGKLQQTKPTGYISLLARESGPVYAEDVDGRGIFSANFEARRE